MWIEWINKGGKKHTVNRCENPFEVDEGGRGLVVGDN